jgi:hypothetical protein
MILGGTIFRVGFVNEINTPITMTFRLPTNLRKERPRGGATVAAAKGGEAFGMQPLLGAACRGRLPSAG